ncbi:GNAT family N-acetyltransferase [Streptomyces sp. 2A115]|uniref:GNAT family N-acetyltransferase n=1 Tax=Streptomyces sp. 2A115 TaxID=3457439 RepID=UPI003FD66C79
MHELEIHALDLRQVDAAVAMHERCSPQTILNRYLQPVPRSGPYVRKLLGTRGGRSFAAVTADARMIGLAHLLPDGDGSCEAALLVEDAHQRRGVGRRLLGALVGAAADAGYASMHGYVRRGNQSLSRSLQELGVPFQQTHDDGLLRISIEVTGEPGTVRRGCAATALPNAGPAPQHQETHCGGSAVSATGTRLAAFRLRSA